MDREPHESETSTGSPAEQWPRPADAVPGSNLHRPGDEPRAPTPPSPPARAPYASPAPSAAETVELPSGADVPAASPSSGARPAAAWAPPAVAATGATEEPTLAFGPGGRPPRGPGRPPGDGGGGDDRQPYRGPGRAAIGGIALLAALLGAGIVVGVLAVAGDLHGNDAATTVIAPSSSAVAAAPASSTHGPISASALYARAVQGVVDITAVSAPQQTQTFPFGGGGSGGDQTDLGSGFEVDNKGDILTAGHVVDGATQITVTLQNGTQRPAKLLGEDRAWDAAVIRINPSGLPLRPLPLGSSRALRVGDYLAAIGDPFGYDRSLSTGVVAGLDRTISAPNGFNIAYAIQTDAALNPGNSGGPVLDGSGAVVGIADQIATGGVQTASGNATSSGVGFAVPIDLAKIDLPRLESGRAATHAYLGVSTTDAPGATGVLLQGITPGTPAADAGLHTGDVLVSFNGQPLHGSADLIDDIATEVPGNQLKLGVKRNGKVMTVTVTLGAQPSQAPTGG